METLQMSRGTGNCTPREKEDRHAPLLDQEERLAPRSLLVPGCERLRPACLLV